MAWRWRNILSATGDRRGHRGASRALPRPRFLTTIVVSDGSELKARLRAEGLDGDDIVLKYCWPRYAPPPGSGIRAIAKSENLVLQFERLIEMHRVAPSSFPMPVATVKSDDGGFVGYILEYVEGNTLRSLLASGMLDEAGRQMDIVEATIAKLHARSMPHGDINPSNIIAADDGRTLLIDPVANLGPGTRLQDELCIAEIRRQIGEASSQADLPRDEPPAGSTRRHGSGTGASRPLLR